MITQSKIGLNSRSEANPFNEDGFLPLITAPMYSVADGSNYQIFLDNKIQVCLPRGLRKTKDNFDTSYPMFVSLSLDEFKEQYVDSKTSLKGFTKKVCIDTANGNMPNLHDFIREAKQIHGSNLIIMAGNVGSIGAFIELAKTGCDYIRVGIGGGGGGNTSSNTGVGQKNLFNLIKDCSNTRGTIRKHYDEFDFSYGAKSVRVKFTKYNVDLRKEDINPIVNVKIVADGISSWVKHCEQCGFNDNGYAAINHLLIAGADLVMVGKLFAQCVESSGEKACCTYIDKDIISNTSALKLYKENYREESTISVQVKYSGMSTQQEQKKYKPIIDDARKLRFSKEHVSIGERVIDKKQEIKPSEGSVQWIPVRWTLDEWLNGSDKQDESPYLMGFVNSLRSMMSYTGKTKL